MAEGFWQSYLPDPRFADGLRAIREAADVYEAARNPRTAGELRVVLAGLLTRIAALSARDAVQASTIVRDTLRGRLVRSESQGPHLASRVRSVGEPDGALHVGSIEDLDRAVDPDYPDSPYWRAIEYGSSAAVGRMVVGYFQPGFAAPSAGQFRQHPFFMSAAASGLMPGGVGTPVMRVQRPIEAKHFLRDGAEEAIARHRAAMRGLLDDAARTLVAVSR